MSAHATVIATPGLPLSFRVGAIRGFLEVGLAGPAMTAVEVQLVDIGDGPSIVVLMHRPDRSIDLAVSDPRLDEAWFRQDPCMCHMPLGRVATAEFHRDHCRIDDRSVSIDLSLDTDLLPGRLEIMADHRFRGIGSPSFVPAVPGGGQRPTLRLIMVGAVRGLPRSADPTITLDGDRLELRPLMKVGPMTLARPARLGSDVLGVGLNLSGAIDVPSPNRELEPARIQAGAEPIELTAGRGQHRLVLRPLTTSGAPATEADIFRPDQSSDETGRTKGRFVIDGSLGTVVTGRWAVERDDADVVLTLDEVIQQWSPGWKDPVGMTRDLARRRRRSGERWQWSGRWRQVDEGTDHHSGRWTVEGKG